MSGILFASDLHLSAALEPQLNLFITLLERLKATESRVYVLGDLVEFWLGDDDPDPVHRRLVAALRELTNAGIPLFVSLGNRDFLIGERFCAETGAALLPDYASIDLFGTPTLLTHGDLLCTQDVAYQEFRRAVREPQRQQQFLSLPVENRRKIAAGTRAGTQASMLEKDSFIMDVDELEVARVMREHQVTQMIHGHTHRPQIHNFTRDGVPHRRIVLGEWYGGTEVLWCTAETQSLVPAEALLARLSR